MIKENAAKVASQKFWVKKKNKKRQRQNIAFHAFLVFYINTNEIPGKLSLENISSDVKMRKDRGCYGYKINSLN